MKEHIKIIDESGDKKYFSQLPHYILNHSTAIDQALYWQMKRYTGESGKCFATQETLLEKMGIGIKAYRKSLKYLLDKGWIKFIGTTKGKTRPIKTYSITDIWKLNILHYEKIPAESTLSFNKDTSQKNSKIPAESTIEEEHIKEDTISKDIEEPSVLKKETYNPNEEENEEKPPKQKLPSSLFGNPEINALLKTIKDEFELPSLDGSIKDQRNFAYHCIRKYGLKECVRLVKLAKENNFSITSPRDIYYKGQKINTFRIRTSQAIIKPEQNKYKGI